MRRWFYFCLLVVFPLLPPAASAGDVDPQAAPVVRALEARYHNAKTLKALFLERYSDGRQGLQAESGTVYFSRPGKMRWEYESPETKLFISDGKVVWFYVPADRMVSRAPLKQSADWRTPLALLTGKAQLSRLCDKVHMTDQLPGVPGNVVLECLPRGEMRAAQKAAGNRNSMDALTDPGSNFDRVFLEVDPKTGQLSDVKIDQPGGIQLEYRFGDWQENLPVSDSQFRFQPPPGVAIVDTPSPAAASQ